MHEQAISELTLAKDLAGACSNFLGLLAYAYAVAGGKPKARGILHDLLQAAETTFISPLSLSKIYIGLNEKERALDYLWKAHDVCAVGLNWLDIDPIFDGIRSSQSFIDLRSRIFAY